MNNFWRMSDFSLLSVTYAYVDHNTYLADQLFAQNKVSLKRKREMVNSELPYRIIFCKVLKRDAKRFEEALGKLTNKMLLLGHRDYPAVCNDIEKMIEAGIKARKENA